MSLKWRSENRCLSNGEVRLYSRGQFIENLGHSKVTPPSHGISTSFTIIRVGFQQKIDHLLIRSFMDTIDYVVKNRSIIW